MVTILSKENFKEFYLQNHFSEQIKLEPSSNSGKQDTHQSWGKDQAEESPAREETLGIRQFQPAGAGLQEEGRHSPPGEGAVGSHELQRWCQQQEH